MLIIQSTILPLISFQSAARAWRVRRGDFGTELKKKLDDRRCGYIGCLDSSMDVKVYSAVVPQTGNSDARIKG